MDRWLTSQTQIDQFTGCQRRWAWRYIAGIKPPPTPAMLLGTEVENTQLQPYLQDGRQPDRSKLAGEIAHAMLPMLPPPKTPGMAMQKHFILPSPTGLFAYQGYIDLWLPDARKVPKMPGLPGRVPFIGDFKTTSDLKWAHGEDSLRTNTQWVLYAMNEVATVGERIPTIDTQWMYGQTRKPHKTKRVHLRVVGDDAEKGGLDAKQLVTPNDVANRFLEIDDIALAMFRIIESGAGPLDLPPTPSHCDAYNTVCPYASNCNLSPSQKLGAKVERKMGDMMSALQALRAKKNGTTVAPAPAPAPVPSPAPPPPPPEPELPAWAKETKPYEGVAAKPPGAPAGINPPESALPPAPPVGVEEPKKRGRPKKVAEAVESSAKDNAELLTKLAPADISSELVVRVVHTFDVETIAALVVAIKGAA